MNENDQFPAGWTEVGATTEPMELRLGDGLKDKAMGAMLGPARIFTRPVQSPIFEAIDRASQDRTPVVESTTDLGSFARVLESLTESITSFTKTVRSATVTATESHAAWKHEMLEQIYGPLEHHRRQVALMGTGYRRHAVPGEQRPGESRAAYARRRRLYSERLRRDRRRRRAGRAPILRSSAFQILIPRAQLDATKVGPEFADMEIVLSAAVPPDQVYIVDHSVLAGEQFVQPYELQPPILFDTAAAERRANWRRDWMNTLGLYGSPTGRFRTTNYFTQMLNAYDQERAGGEGHKPARTWVDDVEVDVDTWMNEGGAE